MLGPVIPLLSTDLLELRRRGRVRFAVGLLGPAFVAAVAYVDPGNFATNFTGGARYGYELAWVIVLANIVGMLVQYVSGKVGLATGRTLPELCRTRFDRRANLLLWGQAEIVAMATDLAEIVGAAIGLHLLFGMPLFAAGVVSAAAAFSVLSLRQRGYRPFELAIVALLMLLAAGIVYDFASVDHKDFAHLGNGLVPHISDAGALQLAVGIVGATVMPHAIYAHSALHQARITAVGRGERRTLLRANRWDCVIGLGAAGAINLAMLCIGASVFAGARTNGSVGLDQIHSRIGQLVGGGAALAFAVSLIASGLASASVGTYSGQVVMSGFTGWRFSIFARRLITIVPALVVLATTSNTSQALVVSQIVLSFGIPFALVPLAIVSNDRRVMAEMTNGPMTKAAMVVVTVAITALNLTLLIQLFTAAG